MWAKLRSRIEKIFIAGILAILPLTITYLLLSFLFRKVDAIFQPLIIRLLQELSYSRQVTYIPGLGIVATILLVFLVGLFVTNIVGAKLVELMDIVLSRIPLVRNIYVASKQFFETLSVAGANHSEMNKVVLVEYPRKGVYSLGFVTCESTGEPQQVTREDVVNVFIPTTPNPTSGMLIMAPRSDLIPLSMSVEEGLKLVVSAGIVTPRLEKDSPSLGPKPKRRWFGRQ